MQGAQEDILGTGNAPSVLPVTMAVKGRTNPQNPVSISTVKLGSSPLTQEGVPGWSQQVMGEEKEKGSLQSGERKEG